MLFLLLSFLHVIIVAIVVHQGGDGWPRVQFPPERLVQLKARCNCFAKCCLNKVIIICFIGSCVTLKKAQDGAKSQL